MIKNIAVISIIISMSSASNAEPMFLEFGAKQGFSDTTAPMSCLYDLEQGNGKQAKSGSGLEIKFDTYHSLLNIFQLNTKNKYRKKVTDLNFHRATNKFYIFKAKDSSGKEGKLKFFRKDNRFWFKISHMGKSKKSFGRCEIK